MAYSFDQVFAADPANPQNIASNAAVLIYQPGDPTKTPLVITDPSGGALSNPVIVNANGFGSAFMHATLDRVAWDGGGFSGFFTSYEGMKQVAVAAQTAAESAAATAGADAAVVATAAIGDATADAAAAATSAATAASNASASATAAANSAALVGAPADSAVATLINATGSAARGALNATYALKSEAGAINYVQARTDRLGLAKMAQSRTRALKAKADGVAAPALTTTVYANGQRTIIYLPTGFDRAVPVPLVIHFHGASSDATSVQWKPMWEAAQAAGFAVATCDFHGNAYGSADVMVDAAAVFDEVLKIAPINGVILSGESMGGIAALNTLTHNVLPDVLGIYLAQPVISLLHRYQNAGHAFIEAAYGINPDGSDYATKTAGYDPHLVSASAFGGVPFYITGSPSDTSALKTPFMDELVTKLAGVSPVTFKAATGGHGDASEFIPADYTAFLKSCAAGLQPPAPAYDFTTDAALLAHFDAATLALADGAAVATWNASGGSHNAALVQATTANQPVYVAADSGIGGKAAVSMDTNVKRLSTAAWGVAEATPITVITVAKVDSGVAGPIWTGQNGVYVNGSTQTTPGISIGAAAVHQIIQPVPSGAQWRIIVAVYDGASSRVRVSGVGTNTGTTTTTAGNANAALPGLRLNTSSDGTGAGATPRFARFAAIKRALTTTEENAVVAALATQYGITI